MSFKKVDPGQKTDYSVIAKFRNKEQVELLISGIRGKGRSCYDFLEIPPDSVNPNSSPEDQMRNMEKVENFYTDGHFKLMFENDLDGLKNAEKVIVLLPAGNSVHIEAGIAYGLGKPLILIGKPEKPETLYLIFEERYDTIEEFLATV